MSSELLDPRLGLDGAVRVAVVLGLGLLAVVVCVHARILRRAGGDAREALLNRGQAVT